MAIRYSSLSGGGAVPGQNSFIVTLDASAKTTVSLDREYAAGGYSIVNSASDTTYDIYAISEDGTYVGYTNNPYLTATEDFSKIVILGSTANNVFTFEYKSKLVTSTIGTDLGAAAFISSVSTSNVSSVDDTFTITGGNFATNMQVFVTGTDSVEREAKSVSRSSSTSAVITRPDLMPKEYSPYLITVKNPGVALPIGSNPHILSNALYAPIWSANTLSLPSKVFKSLAFSHTIGGIIHSGTISSFTVLSGSLPTGLTLNSSTGVISGTPTTDQTGSTTFRVTASNSSYNDYSWSWAVSAATIVQITSSQNYTTPAGVSSVSALIVGGGGGGGQYNGDNGGNPGGGGGSGYWNYITNIPAGTHTIVVGSGGGSETSGSFSRITTAGGEVYTSNGGERGFRYNDGNGRSTGGGNGGSGGGGGGLANWSLVGGVGGSNGGSGTAGYGPGGAGAGIPLPAFFTPGLGGNTTGNSFGNPGGGGGATGNGGGGGQSASFGGGGAGNGGTGAAGSVYIIY